MKQLTVEISAAPQEYNISIGNNCLNVMTEKIIEENPEKKLIMISDTIVNQFWGAMVMDAFQNKGKQISNIVFPAGEAFKTRKTKEDIENQLFTMSAGRDSVIVALGGGVVGDIAGFVASTYMRGIPYYQIPTTLLAQADSSFGGKTGIDVEFGKNLLGTFYQPKQVFIDTHFLTTLDHENFKSGFVEIIKHGVIYDPKLYQFLFQKMDQILARNSIIYEEILLEILYQNCHIKKDIVSKDPTEKGLRKILNFGHTIGHAIEFLSQFTISHGQAVAMGMIMEAYIGCAIGRTNQEVFQSLCEIFKILEIPYRVPKQYLNEEMYQTMLLDKKVRKGNVEFVVVENIGTISKEITCVISKEEFKTIVQDFTLQIL